MIFLLLFIISLFFGGSYCSTQNDDGVEIETVGQQEQDTPRRSDNKELPNFPNSNQLPIKPELFGKNIDDLLKPYINKLKEVCVEIK